MDSLLMETVIDALPREVITKDNAMLTSSLA